MPATLEAVEAPSLRALDPQFEALFERTAAMASLPTVALQIIELAKDENGSIEEMCRVIEQDPALTLKIVKTVNSSFYALRTEVADLPTAASMLGLKKLRDAAFSVSMGRHFNRPTPVGGLDRRLLWTHSVSVAAAARLIANITQACPPDEAYLVALLHDLGLLVADEHFSQKMPRVIAEASTGKDMIAVEQGTLGFDHAQLGAYIVARSKLPARVSTAVSYHHHPLDCPEETLKLTCVIAASNYIATRYGNASFSGRRLHAASPEVFAAIGLGKEELTEAWERLPQLFDSAAELMGVS